MQSSTLPVNPDSRLQRLELSEDEQAFQKIVQAYRDRNVKLLEAETLRLQSRNSQSPLLASSVYLSGLLSFEMQDKNRARAKFVEVLSRFPESERVSAALYALGYVEQSQNSITLAKNLYQRLITYYPESPEANRAKLQLEIIERGLHEGSGDGKLTR